MNLARLLTPGWHVDLTLAQLPLDDLLARPIRALVLDVDCTLLPRRQAALPPAAARWLEQAAHRVPVHLFSNNPSRQRIGGVAAAFDLPFTTAAGKPRRGPLTQVVERLGLPGHEVALIGDRVFTDVVAGNRLGLFTVLVQPIAADGHASPHNHLQRLEVRLAQWMGGRLA
ncbi:MAG: YqeG family HAD IIIA-type phosphatase [Prochlorococcaceae cyanobacterium]